LADRSNEKIDFFASCPLYLLLSCCYAEGQQQEAKRSDQECFFENKTIPGLLL
jgi:hypothetical protein